MTPKFGDIPKKILHELSNNSRERNHRKQHASHERKHLEHFESQDQFLSKEELKFIQASYYAAPVRRNYTSVVEQTMLEYRAKREKRFLM
jgi:hypothetical protein